MVDLLPHDIEVHVVFPLRASLNSGGIYRARFKDDPAVEGFGLTERRAIDDLYEARRWRQEKASRVSEDPLSCFMRHAAILIESVTKMGWQISGSPAISPNGEDGGGEVTLTMKLAHRRTAIVFAIDELPGG